MSQLSQLRTNVRNFLLPMTEAEVQVELNLSVEAGDVARAAYVEEFLCELQAECNACPVCEDDTVGPDCSGCHLDTKQGGCAESADFAELEAFLGLDDCADEVGCNN